ncbi:MAG: SurA N-terminal domain-containing protein [Bdellovibrionales bacterium]
MFRKISRFFHGQEFSFKSWVAAVLFGAIILVFALFGIQPDQFGEGTGGVAAVVNGKTISIAEFRSRVESMEQNLRGSLGDLPADRRQMMEQEMRRRAMNDLIVGEIVYQSASQKGVTAADAEVRDYILDIPWLNENGRFLRDRYRAYLQNVRLTSEDFERQIRKQLVAQKMQELFVAAATPTREEIKRARQLANQKVNLKFVQIDSEDWRKPGLVPDSEARQFATQNAAEIQKYYEDHKIEYTQAESVKARHILISTREGRSDADALKLAQEVKGQLKVGNFAALAKKFSEDPGSKDKGGDLGEFGRGRMVPEFEKAAFSLPAGQISEPVKSPFGYHILWVEKKTEAETKPLETVSLDIARKLLGDKKKDENLTALRALVEKGDRAQVSSWMAKAGFKWEESGEFDLAANQVPKLGEAPIVLEAVLRQGRAGGLVKQLISSRGQNIIVDVTSWKETADKSPEAAGLEQMVAYRKSADLIQSWSKEIEAGASIHRNPKLIQ